ncbi:MAG: hypothetical protein HC919_05270 [Oscillatoriales cyanobacterium SM2_2_1]|nr:hypothetical protein [Oscillatoriales cyanobacterium SM2_2_1]
MMFGSVLVIVHRLHSLQLIPESDLGLPLNEVFVNIRLLSVTSQVTLAAIPLLLGMGLWGMNSWARVLSICFFGALFAPSTLVLGGILADPQWSTEVNALVTGGSGLFLGILLHPSLGQSFARRSPLSDP